VEPVDETTAARIAALSPQKRAVLEQWLRSAGGRPPPVAGDPTDRPVDAGASDAERILTEICAAVLRVDGVRPTDSFLSLGGDSISSLQVVSRAAAAGLRLSSRDVIEAPDLRQLAKLARAGAARTVLGEPTGEVECTPIQRWFFAQEFPESHRWDQAILIELRERADEDLLAGALRVVVSHHDALRGRFTKGDHGWRQLITADAPRAVLTTVDSGGDAALAEATAAAQRAIDIRAGRPVAAVLLRDPDRLLLAIHHLVVDGVSLRIIVEDLDTAYRALRDGIEPRLPAPTTSFRHWAAALRRYADREEVLAELPYWTGIAAAHAGSDPARAGTPVTADNRATDRRTANTGLGRELSARLLHRVARYTRFTVEQVLIASLALVWRRVRGCDTLAVDLEGHGREPIAADLDVSRTVGWFTTIYPARFTPPDGGPLDVLRHVAGELAAVPGHGIGYGVLRYLSGHGAALDRRSSTQVSFNYLGRFDAPDVPGAVLGAPVEIPTVLQSGDAIRPYLIDVIATALADDLLLRWDYASRAVPGEDVEAMLAAQVDAVRELVDAALDAPDYDLARLDARQVQGVRERLALRRRR
jgi:non-ribosomal peptide synthase protein (TIGR01720 family)